MKKCSRPYPKNTYLVKNGSGCVVHFVELVDAADSVVGEDQGSGLQHHLASVRVLRDVSRQTHGAGSLTQFRNYTRN